MVQGEQGRLMRTSEVAFHCRKKPLILSFWQSEITICAGVEEDRDSIDYAPGEAGSIWGKHN